MGSPFQGPLCLGGIGREGKLACIGGPDRAVPAPDLDGLVQPRTIALLVLLDLTVSDGGSRDYRCAGHRPFDGPDLGRGASDPMHSVIVHLALPKR
jgi:hypothetical protein